MYLKNPDDPNKNWDIYNIMGDIFSLTLGFGDPPSNMINVHGEGVGPGEWFVFILAMFIVLIIILNTLIAILGDR